MSNVFKSFGKAVEKGVKSQKSIAQRGLGTYNNLSNKMNQGDYKGAWSDAGKAARTDWREGKKDYQGAVDEATTAGTLAIARGINDSANLHDKLGRKIGVSESLMGDEGIGRSTLHGLNALGENDTRLLNQTDDLKAGVFNKGDRVEATKKSANGLNTIKTVGSIAAATNIPIVSWIGLAANAIANARLSEAGIQSERQGWTNFGLSGLGAAAGGAGAQAGIGNIGTAGRVGLGAVRGAINADAAGGNVGKGAVVGGLTAGAGGIGQAIGGTAGAAVGGALGAGAAAYAGGARGSDLWEQTLAGGAAGATGAYGKSEGWAPWMTGATQGAIRGGLKGGSEGALYGALGGGLNASGTAGKVANTVLQQQRNQQLAKARATQRTSTSPYAAGRV